MNYLMCALVISCVAADIYLVTLIMSYEFVDVHAGLYIRHPFLVRSSSRHREHMERIYSS